MGISTPLFNTTIFHNFPDLSFEAPPLAAPASTFSGQLFVSPV
jgi:hypothetical protein